MSTSWFSLVSQSEIREGRILSIPVGGREIALGRTRDGIFAIEDRCPHAETRLSEGRLRGCRIVCPLHGASFDVRDGRVLGGPAQQPVQTYTVRIADDLIEVLLPDPPSTQES